MYVGKKKQAQAILGVLMMAFLLIGMIPGVSIAAVDDENTTSDNYTTLRGLTFVNEEDSTLSIGESKTIEVKLNRIPSSMLFTGAVNAAITDPEGKVTQYSVSGGGGYYSISNVTLYTPGDYTLKVSAVDPNKGSASGTIRVLDAVATVTGSLIVNLDNTLSVKLTDTEGNILQQKSVIVDGTAVDASPATQNYTTLNDGTFVLNMTPLKAGNVNIIYSGKIIETIPIRVLNAVAMVTGSLVVNTNSLLSIKIADTEGNILQQKSVIVDGAAVNASPATQSYTTLNDGTFALNMTPLKAGNVNIIYSGKIIGTISVNPAFAASNRIGSQTSDNVALSVEVAKQGWQTTANVILARDDQFSDSLAAVPLSKKLDAPILMTNSVKLDELTLAELHALGAKNVYIVGGTVAISQGIHDSLSSNGFTVTRIAGQQGYDTAALISANVGIDPTHTVYLTNGHAIPDAIAISAFAAEQGNPILLTDRNSIPASTLQALADLKVSNVILLGGTAVIGTSVENALRAKYSVKRWGGYDRYDTQSIIFQNLFNTQISQSPIYFTSGLVRQDDVSSGKPYADALLTAALAARIGGFVVLIPPSDGSSFSLSSSPNNFLLMNKAYISQSTVVGNYNAVSGLMEGNLQRLLTH